MKVIQKLSNGCSPIQGGKLYRLDCGIEIELALVEGYTHPIAIYHLERGFTPVSKARKIAFYRKGDKTYAESYRTRNYPRPYMKKSYPNNELPKAYRGIIGILDSIQTELEGR